MKTLFSLMLCTVTLFAQSGDTPAPLKFPYEPSNAVIRYDSTHVDVERDGRNVSINHYRIAVLTDRAIKEFAQDVSVYNLGYDTIEVLTARVHLPGGKVIDVDSSMIKDVPMPAFGKFFLHNVREKIITFPELTEGAEIEVALKTTTREPPMDGEFDFQAGFESDNPVQTKYVEIVAPAGMELRWKAHSGEIPYTKSARGDKVAHVWQMANIPQTVPEPGMPPWPEVARSLLVTTVDNWEKWSEWYDSLAGPMMVADDSIRAEVRALIKDATTRDEKIRKLFYYVSNQIRYVETAMTGRKAGYKPEAASVTYRNKYGVCRDKAALLVTMLREAGIEADITLMNPSWKIDGDMPVDQFNHAIVAVHDGDSIIWVDPTVEKTKDFLAGNEQDRAVLVCDHNGDPLRWTPVEKSEQNLYQIRADSHLDQDGLFHSLVTISTKGLPDLILRNWLQSQSPQHREDTFKRIVQGIATTAVLESFEVSDALDFDKQIEIKLAFSAKDYSIPAGDYLLFQVPNQASGLDFLTGWFLSGSELTDRRYDLRLESTFAVRAEETVTFPAGFKVRSIPETVNKDYGDFRLARDFSQKGNTLQCRRVMDFSTLSVPLGEYAKLQDLLKKDDTMGRGQVVLVKG